MIHFSGEEQRIETIAKQLSAEFALADRLGQAWIAFSADEDRWWSKLPLDVARVAMLLNMQAIRQFRIAVDACRRSEAFCANIMLRSLYETLLASSFVISLGLGIVVEAICDAHGNPAPDRDGLQKYRARPRTEMDDVSACATREVRTTLYLAHTALAAPRPFEKIADVAEAATAAVGISVSANLKALVAPNLQQYAREVGPGWIYVLKHSPHTYSGLRSSELAAAIAPVFSHWHSLWFQIQCHAVHGADALSLVGARDDGRVGPLYFSTTDEVRGALEAAIFLVIACINTFQAEVDFGEDAVAMLRDCPRDFDSVFGYSDVAG